MSESDEARLRALVLDEMASRVAEGRRRAEAFGKATQGTGKPFAKMRHGDGEPPKDEKPKKGKGGR